MVASMNESQRRVEIRPATAGDADSITQLINLAYAVEAFFVEGPRIDREEVTGKIRAGHFFAAVSDSAELVGCISYQELDDRAYFGLLAVAPTARGLGLGRRMIEFVEQRARDAGLTCMTLRTVDLRTELPPWYQRQGYQQVGEERFDDPRKIRPCKFLLFEKQL
jgi:ribosomal protein S18 acetylase RimI-like enzyme